MVATPSTSVGTVRWVTPLLCMICIPPSWVLEEYTSLPRTYDTTARFILPFSMSPFSYPIPCSVPRLQ